LFKAELEKFRPHQNRILQANHKQSSLLKELTRTYSDLLKDKRVRSEQSKYDAFSRQRNTVMTKYRRVFQSFNDLSSGLLRAQNFYSEMKDTVLSLHKNVDTFVNNRRGEGGQLLAQIEQKSKTQGADQEQQRLKDLMDRMSMEPSGSPNSQGGGRKKSLPPPLSSTPGYPSTSNGGHPAYNPAASPPVTPRYPIATAPGQQFMSPQQPYGGSSNAGYNQPPPPRRESYQQQQSQYPSHQPQSSQSSSGYNPAVHNQYNPTSPPAHQQFFSPPPPQHQQHQPWGQAPQNQQQQQWGGAPQGNLPQGYVPPPPPPGPPPSQHQDYSHFSQGGYPSGPGGYASANRQGQGQQGQGGNDPWAGLSGWK
jgi:programmed cell death 6-interacting protein